MMTVRRDRAARDITRRIRPELIILGALIVASALLVPKVVDVARYDVAIVRFPFQVDDAEGVVLAEARLIADRTDPYAFQPSPAHYFYAGPYTPLYTLLNSAAMATAGPTFKFGRSVQLLATLIVAGWLAWAVRRSAAGRMGWVLGGWTAALFATAHLVAVWSVRVRPDMTALMWNLVGVALLRDWLDVQERTPWRESSWPRDAALMRLAIGAACFALGWWTKQTFIAVPLAYIFSVSFVRPKIGLTVLGLYGALIAVPFGLLTALTRGGFVQKVIGYQGSWEWAAFRRLAQPFAERYALLLGLALIAAGILLWLHRRPPFAVGWLGLSAVFALGAGTSGGNHNHFVELVAAASLILGQALARMLASPRASVSRAGPWPVAIVAIVLIAVSIVSVTENEGSTGWLARDYRRPTAAEREGLASIASLIANSPGPVYSNNVGILVITGQPVRVTDPFTMAAEVRLGRWDDSLLIADVAAGAFPVIALSYNDVASLDADLPPTDATPGLIRAIQARYRLVERNVLRIYVPK
jgi:hypothetical protein